jgi:hypothetical protein
MSSQVEDFQMALTRYSSLDKGHSGLKEQVWKQFQHSSLCGLDVRLLEIKLINGWNTPPHKDKI